MRDKVAILIDLTKCVGCRACQVACKEWNGLEGQTTSNRGTYENPPSLSPETWTKIDFIESSGEEGVDWTFFKQQCLHCTDAACVEVCPTEALRTHPLGFVSFEEDRCIGCGYCAEFCPFGIPQMKITSLLAGTAVASKCTFCQDRLTSGMEAICSKSCPAGAISFGLRNDMVLKGEERVAALKESRDDGAKINLYGANLLGGLGMMYVLPDEPGAFGLPSDPRASYSLAAAWQGRLQPLGGILIGVGAVTAGINWIIARRMANQAVAARAEAGKGGDRD